MSPARGDRTQLHVAHPARLHGQVGKGAAARDSWCSRAAVFGLAAALLTAGSAASQPSQLNGFALAPAGVPIEQILRGGPPRDAIPALDAPKAVDAANATWADEERVLGVALGGEARAYPLAILVWHELVNDRVGGQPILVSYCPLCGTGIVFDRSVDGEVLRFGVSGLLYLSDVLMFDRESESLWSQISARAVTGTRLGTRLGLLRSRMTTWGSWKADHPATSVITSETGHGRAYGTNPYGDYARSAALRFPAPRDPRYHAKLPTLGLRLGDSARAYPASEVQRAGGCVRELFAGHEVEVRWTPRGGFRVEAPEPVEVIEGFWFAWAAFHPETEVLRASDTPEGTCAN